MVMYLQTRYHNSTLQEVHVGVDTGVYGEDLTGLEFTELSTVYQSLLEHSIGTGSIVLDPTYEVLTNCIGIANAITGFKQGVILS